MSDNAVLMLVWRRQGETLVIPMADSDGEDTLLVRQFIDQLPQRVADTATVALLQGVIADQRDIIVKLRCELAERKRMADQANELVAHYRERGTKEQKT